MYNVVNVVGLYEKTANKKKKVEMDLPVCFSQITS